MIAKLKSFQGVQQWEETQDPQPNFILEVNRIMLTKVTSTMKLKFLRKFQHTYQSKVIGPTRKTKCPKRNHWSSSI